MPWTPEFRSDLVQNLMHPFPLLNDASDKIWLRLAHWLRRYSSLKMFTDRQTHNQPDRQTTDRLVYYKLTMSLRLRSANNVSVMSGCFPRLKDKVVCSRTQHHIPGEIRTRDLAIKSPALYQPSYRCCHLVVMIRYSIAGKTYQGCTLRHIAPNRAGIYIGRYNKIRQF